MNEKIEKALNLHFQNNRLIFWYDDGGKMEEEFKSYNELGTEKKKIENNEFYIRYLIQKLNPDKKYLIYSPDKKPKDSKNWLLDLNLSNFVFASDEVAMYVQELGLNDDYLDFIKKYIHFFKNKKERLNPLKVIIDPETVTEDDLLLSMLSVLCSSSKDEKLVKNDFNEIALKVAIDTYLEKDNQYWKNIQKFNLESTFWKLSEIEFSYSAEEKDIKGLFNHIMQHALKYQLRQNITADYQKMFSIVEKWRNNLKYTTDVKDILEKLEKELNIKHELENDISIEILTPVDLFKEADRQIFRHLLTALNNKTLDITSALHLLERRRETFWYKNDEDEKLKDHYQALYYYLRFRELMMRTDITFKDLDAGWMQYKNEYYQLDEAYRKFLYYFEKSGSSNGITELLDIIEKEYTEGYLQPLSSCWQKALDSAGSLDDLKVQRQCSFFEKHVKPYLEQDLFIFVIVSDGMRYDIGAELSGIIEMQNRFKADLSEMVSSVPSYTQLGMASLLPHESISISESGDTVFIDGKTSKGHDKRENILQDYLDENFPGKKAKALNSRNFMEMTVLEQEEKIKGVDLVYLFSSGVDSIADNAKNEKSLPSEAEREIKHLTDLTRKIVNLNRTHILITADHGFLYRYKPNAETDWIKQENDSEEIKKDHRFVFSSCRIENEYLDYIKPEECCFESDRNLYTARGISRIKKQGGGSRYVHGGRMLHEICIPLLTLKKTRIDDVRAVDISVIDRKTSITTGQISIKFIQETASDYKNQSREITAVFEGNDGEELSAPKKLIFDSTDSNSQNRTRTESFVFYAAADKYNMKNIFLRFYDIKSGGTKVFYKEYSYLFRKNIQSDFDF